ncbi:MAG: bifunctional riboflavin kinase/FAD synthetase [Pseudobdellovibrionaceae bacterium]
MEWISNISSWIKRPSSSVITIGSFDGAHRGHQALIQKLLKQSQKHSAPSVVFTFDPHPVQILYPEKGFVRLFDWVDQKEQFTKLGVSAVVIEAFSRELSQKNPEDFLNEYILAPLHPRAIVVGHDFAFGMNRAGNLEFMKSFCAKNKIEFEIVDAFKVDSVIVSSSRIREHVVNGKAVEAATFLGRPYYLKGVVEKGAERGRTIGVPTANIKPSTDLVPKKGVYASRVVMTSGTFAAVTNIGTNPTFTAGDHQPIKVESHIFGFSGDIYGEEIRVELFDFIRPENKFSSIDELKLQIQKDIVLAKEILEKSKT